MPTSHQLLHTNSSNSPFLLPSLSLSFFFSLSLINGDLLQSSRGQQQQQQWRPYIPPPFSLLPINTQTPPPPAPPNSKPTRHSIRIKPVSNHFRPSRYLLLQASRPNANRILRHRQIQVRQPDPAGEDRQRKTEAVEGALRAAEQPQEQPPDQPASFRVWIRGGRRYSLS